VFARDVRSACDSAFCALFAQIRDAGRVAWQAQQALGVLRMLRLASPHDEAHACAEALCLCALGRRGEALELLRAFRQLHPEALGAVQVGGGARTGAAAEGRSSSGSQA
jgi:hypothetical protein